MGMVTGTSPACQESRVWVRVWVRGYRYKLLYPDKYHEYGYNGQGYYKATSLLSWALYSYIWKTWLQVCLKEGSAESVLPVILVHLWYIQNKLVLKKDTDDIIHVWGGQKSFHTCWGGVQKVLAACEGGGQKSLTTKIFNCPAPPPKYLWILP